MWSPQVVTDLASAEADLIEMDPAQAQPYCNFQILFPESLPAGYACSSASLRRECVPGRPPSCSRGRSGWSIANNGSIRFEFTDGDSRIRMKEFLYDWAPPAADQPSLWSSATRACEIVAPYVVWLGTDYNGHRAAYARIGRTSCELSVTHGDATRFDIVEFYRSLRSPSPQALVSAIHETPFARLSYWARHRPGLVNAPYALWRFRRSRPREEYFWLEGPAISSDDGLPLATLGGWEGFQVDSVGFFGKDAAREREVIFTAGPDRGQEVRVIYYRQGGAHDRIGSEPGLERHPCITLTTNIRNRLLNVALVSRQVGPYNVVFEDSAWGLKGLVCTSAARGFDWSWFEWLMAHLDFE